MLKKGDKTGKGKKIEFMKKLHLLELTYLTPKSKVFFKQQKLPRRSSTLILLDLGKSDHLIDVITKRSEKNRLQLSVRS